MQQFNVRLFKIMLLLTPPSCFLCLTLPITLKIEFWGLKPIRHFIFGGLRAIFIKKIKSLLINSNKTRLIKTDIHPNMYPCTGKKFAICGKNAKSLKTQKCQVITHSTLNFNPFSCFKPFGKAKGLPIVMRNKEHVSCV